MRRASETGVPRGLVLCAVVCVVLALCGCVGPAVTEHGYRIQVTGALGQISSALASARLAVGLDLDGKMALSLTDQTVSDAESDAESAQAALESRQPPNDAALRLHDRVSTPIRQAVDALQALRLAVRRGVPDEIRRAWRGLDGPAGQLTQLAGDVSG